MNDKSKKGSVSPRRRSLSPRSRFVQGRRSSSQEHERQRATAAGVGTSRIHSPQAQRASSIASRVSPDVMNLIESYNRPFEPGTMRMRNILYGQPTLELLPNEVQDMIIAYIPLSQQLTDLIIKRLTGKGLSDSMFKKQLSTILSLQKKNPEIDYNFSQEQINQIMEKINGMLVSHNIDTLIQLFNTLVYLKEAGIENIGRIAERIDQIMHQTIHYILHLEPEKIISFIKNLDYLNKNGIDIYTLVDVGQFINDLYRELDEYVLFKIFKEMKQIGIDINRYTDLESELLNIIYDGELEYEEDIEKFEMLLDLLDNNLSGNNNLYYIYYEIGRHMSSEIEDQVELYKILSSRGIYPTMDDVEMLRDYDYRKSANIVKKYIPRKARDRSSR